MTTKEEMAAKILEVIDREGGFATFPPIMDALGPDARGNYEWILGAPNIVVWSGMSQVAIDAFESVRNLIEPVPSHWLCYMMDGATLALPLVKSARAQGYKKPHWLPVSWHRRETPRKEPLEQPQW